VAAQQIVAILGPTASGKTRLGVDLARRYEGEIVSADSRQVYRRLNIGTGKDLTTYREGGKPVKYHLIDVVEPVEEYNLMKFCRETPGIIRGIEQRRHLPIIVGRTALYINSLLEGYQLPGGPPDAAMRKSWNNYSEVELAELLKDQAPDLYDELKDQNNRTRLYRALEKVQDRQTDHQLRSIADYSWLLLGVYFSRQEIHHRIKIRLEQRLADGMVQEIKGLHHSGISWERLDFLGLEYRYISRYLQGIISYDEMAEQLLAKIRQLAKRQDVWFRKMERNGHPIHWLPEGDFAQASKLVTSFLSNHPLPSPQIRLNDIRYGPKSE